MQTVAVPRSELMSLGSEAIFAYNVLKNQPMTADKLTDHLLKAPYNMSHTQILCALNLLVIRKLIRILYINTTKDSRVQVNLTVNPVI